MLFAKISPEGPKLLMERKRGTVEQQYLKPKRHTVDGLLTLMRQSL